MAKIAITVQELIDKLQKIDNKELEVWVRGGDLRVIPCDEVIECSGDGNYLVLSNHREINMNDIMESLKATGNI